MPFMRVRRGNKLYNYTRGPNNKPTGKPHGSFPNNAEGKKRADAQLGILWAAYRRETKAMLRYKDISFKPPPAVAATAHEALNAGNEISGVTRSLAFHEPLTSKTVRQLHRRFKRRSAARRSSPGFRGWSRRWIYATPPIRRRPKRQPRRPLRRLITINSCGFQTNSTSQRGVAQGIGAFWRISLLVNWIKRHRRPSGLMICDCGQRRAMRAGRADYG